MDALLPRDISRISITGIGVSIQLRTGPVTRQAAKCMARVRACRAVPSEPRNSKRLGISMKSPYLYEGYVRRWHGISESECVLKGPSNINVGASEGLRVIEMMLRAARRVLALIRSSVQVTGDADL